MDAKEFVQSVYKGKNLDKCEEHIKSYCKKLVLEKIPGHFEQIKKYQGIIAAQKAMYEAVDDCDDDDSDDDDSDDDIDEGVLPDDVKDKVTKVLKSIKNFKELDYFEIQRNNKEAYAVAKFKSDLDDEDVNAVKSKLISGLKRENLKGEIDYKAGDTDEISFSVLG